MVWRAPMRRLLYRFCELQGDSSFAWSFRTLRMLVQSKTSRYHRPILQTKLLRIFSNLLSHERTLCNVITAQIRTETTISRPSLVTDRHSHFAIFCIRTDVLPRGGLLLHLFTANRQWIPAAHKGGTELMFIFSLHLGYLAR